MANCVPELVDSTVDVFSISSTHIVLIYDHRNLVVTAAPGPGPGPARHGAT
jgi:hypothetical protein